MTVLENIYKELSERFKDEPNKNKILGTVMGVLERHKAALINEQIEKLRGSIYFDNSKGVNNTE